MSYISMEHPSKSPYKNDWPNNLTIGFQSQLTLYDAKLFALNNMPIHVTPESYLAMDRSHQFLKTCVEQRIPIYGINTNFGDQVSLLDRHLKQIESATPYQESIQNRQENIIRSLACSLGNVVSPSIVRVSMLLRAHCLAQGYSGVDHNVVDAILAFLGANIIPVVRQYGSIGASGDLIPLASITAAIIGEDVDVFYNNEIMRAPKAIKLAGLKKFTPKLREGIAMINGTSFMTAIASISLYNLKRLFPQMLSALAMALESLLVISSAYHPLVHQLKRQAGENAVNDFLLHFWKDSHLLSNLDEVRHNVLENSGSRSVQDYYSLRAVSQGFGPMLENIERAIIWIENEMNSVNDNPIVDVKNNAIHHNANFMGYYVTDACDILKLDIAQASTWLHAVLANMVHPRKNQNLPTNLVIHSENNNGFRSLQLLAAALSVQNRKLAQGHQAYMLPTEGDNQDVNSLGTHAALDFQEAVANLERLTAIVLLAATQALEFRGITKASSKAQEIFNTVRHHFSQVEHCRPMTEELHRVINLFEEEKI